MTITLSGKAIDLTDEETFIERVAQRAADIVAARDQAARDAFNTDVRGRGFEVVMAEYIRGVRTAVAGAVMAAEDPAGARGPAHPGQRSLAADTSPRSAAGDPKDA